MQNLLTPKLFSLVLLSILLSGCFGRPFPKRLKGSYLGYQEKYTVTIDEKAVNIPETNLRVDLQYDHLIINTEQQKNSADYSVSKKTNNYYPLVVTFKDGSIEHWKLYPKGKKLIRAGQAPRPTVTFLKD